MIGLQWIQVSANGKDVPVRVDDIREVRPVGGDDGGAEIHFKDGRPPLEVDETPAAIYTSINTLRTDYNTALGDPA